MATYNDVIDEMTTPITANGETIKIFLPDAITQIRSYFMSYDGNYTSDDYNMMFDVIIGLKDDYKNDLSYTDTMFDLLLEFYDLLQCNLSEEPNRYVLRSTAIWSDNRLLVSTEKPYSHPPLAYAEKEKLVNEVTFGGETLLTVRDTTATEADVLAGKVFTKKDGAKGTGTVAAYTGSTTVTPSRVAQTLPTAGKTVASNIAVSGVTAAVDSNITAGNIKNGVNILGITGNLIEGSGEMKIAMFSQLDKWEGTINEFFQQKVHAKIPAIADIYSVAYAEITFCSYYVPPDTEKHITIGDVSGNVVKLIFEYNGVPESLADINAVFNENYLNDQTQTSGNIGAYDAINILQNQRMSYKQSMVIIKYVLR